ncbi:P-loop containing nucleoside triphosphate hydrolase protein [Coemansia reversa NRRL 1564]|uniref:P-loop containing nucleoside triphosphate hydrolase protein n=1 Tax=Coemansia reversa (strain ATCC 12441 / NRRL 1564) TaxID=763665 RepID=A0A2G5BAA8_COERN|nr:P-loop containing nucleoside triphosphate hydrolase protein [Coemansia reversa NRRL 1564]|eukprot:PIA15930.1 P-loop containing nucleoside triphosphate hydrolase protein [Coemansia reversa NRRL 1564]
MVRAQELRQIVRNKIEDDQNESSEDEEEEGEIDELIAKELKEQSLDLKSTTQQTTDSIKHKASDVGSLESSSTKKAKQPKSLEDSSDMYLMMRLLWQYKGSMKMAIPGVFLSFIDGLVGKSVALVGASGSGKTSLIRLAQRLYDVNSGSVSVEGLDVRDWNIMALRNNMALVSQEPVLFNYTIAENIEYGKPGATQQEIEEAAKEANIYNFVHNLPDGFNTSVGQIGGRLSGGQKQRVAIARALVRKPKLLLLDEATAALDSRSEKIVQKVLDKAAKERTTLTIAHRLNTIQDCDLIVVFKKGRIVERGTHDELLARKGAYHLLVQQQSLQVTH